MEDRRIGQLLRAVRQRRRLRQTDFGSAAGVSQAIISRLERGRLESVKLSTIRRVALELDVSIAVSASWRGGKGDRLVDRAHAAIVDHVIDMLQALDWEVAAEFSFNHFGDRGSVDVLAWHPTERILLIIEVKASLTNLQELLHSLSRKLRIVPDLARRQRGWDPVHVSHILVVSGSRANRSVVARHAATFDASFPTRTWALRSWLRRPKGTAPGLWFVPTSALGSGASVARARVRRPRG